MLERLIPLIILFFVIIDPFASFAVFFVATDKLDYKKKRKIGMLSILVATLLSFSVLLLGERLLAIFDTSIEEFKVAGGIILLLLGIKMVWGESLTSLDKVKDDSGAAIAAIIATPLLTGPATITTIIVSVHDYGMLVTGLAVAIVLFLTALMFYFSTKLNKFLGKTAIQVMSTILGLITLAWGVKFIRIGLGF